MNNQLESKCLNCDKEIPFNHAQIGGVHMTCEQAYFHNKTERMIKIRPESGGAWLVCNESDLLSALRAVDDLGESYQLKISMLSKHEAAILPEFDGW